MKDWITTAKHPKTGKLYTEMVYQPMLEVLAYLRANGFKTFIVSGGGIEFMRPWAEKTYGIPPEQVVGSSIKTKFEMRDGKPVLVRLPELNFNDDKGGKPVGINQHIGRRPIAAFGNSDSDLQMLQYTRRGQRRTFLPLCPPRRRGAGIRLRPGTRTAGRQPWPARPGTRRGTRRRRLDRGQHEERLEDHLPGFEAEVTAIDILLEPDATMLRHAAANNARLLGVFPRGFALDATHRPHITMLQCFVRTADLEKVYAAEEKVFVAANVKALKLEAFKYYYAAAGDGLGVAGICARPTPEILKLQADVIAAAKPFMLETAPIGAFTAPHDNPATDAAIIQYVSTFVPKMSGENFNPHVSTGTAATGIPRQDARRAV